MSTCLIEEKTPQIAKLYSNLLGSFQTARSLFPTPISQRESALENGISKGIRRFTQNWREGERIKTTLNWRGERDLEDKRDALTWRWLDLDEVLAFFEDGRIRSRNFGGTVEMEEKEEERNETREGIYI